MKTKRKGPRYVWPGKFNSFLPFDKKLRVDMLHDDVIRHLNAGERAKAEVRRLKAELAKLHWHFERRHEVQGCADIGWWCMQCGEGPQR